MRRSVVLLVLVGLVFVGLAVPAAASAARVATYDGVIIGRVTPFGPNIHLVWSDISNDVAGNVTRLDSDHPWRAERRYDGGLARLNHPKKYVWTVTMPSVFLGRAVWDGDVWVLSKSIKGNWRLLGYCEPDMGGQFAAGALFCLWK